MYQPLRRFCEFQDVNKAQRRTHIMSKMIKLSKSDWLRIGKEFGFFRQASPEDIETAGLPSQPPSVILLRGQDARRRLSEMGRRDETPRGSGLGEGPPRTPDFSDQVLWEMLDGPGGSGNGEGPDDELTDDQLKAMEDAEGRRRHQAFLKAEDERRARARERRRAREKEKRERQEAFDVEPKLQEDGS